jgi:hypothetical protein
MARGKIQRQVELTRKEIDAIILYVNLNDNVESVKIEQNSSSGIGPTTMAHYSTGEGVVTADITDVSAW